MITHIEEIVEGIAKFDDFRATLKKYKFHLEVENSGFTIKYGHKQKKYETLYGVGVFVDAIQMLNPPQDYEDVQED